MADNEILGDAILDIYPRILELSIEIWDARHLQLFRLGEIYILSSDFGTKSHLDKLGKLFREVSNSLEEVKNVAKQISEAKDDMQKMTRLSGQYEILLSVYQGKLASFNNYLNELSSEYKKEMLIKKDWK